MKQVLIVGASGMVGGIILREALMDQSIDTVICINRKSLGIEDPKLKELLHNDFMSYQGQKKAFKDIHAAYFCIGVYTGAVKDDLFKKITVDFAKVFADTLKEQSPKASLNFLSGQGADQSEKSKMSFAKYKGMAENYLIAKNFTALNLFRPAYIYPVEKRMEPNFSYRIFRSFYPFMKNLFPKTTITSEELAKAMFKAGMQKMNKGVLENEQIKMILK